MGSCASKFKTSKPEKNGYTPANAAADHYQSKQDSPQPQSQSQPKPKPPVRVPSPAKSDPNSILGKPFEDVKTCYSLGKELGRGQFGVTYLCTDKNTGEELACKSISKKKLVTKADKEDMKRAIQIMQHLSGQNNIVEFKGAYEDRTSVNLVMELCGGGELFDRIIAKGHYSEKAAANIVRQIFNVVHVRHFMGVMHRDLKPENFLLSSPDENATLKATDFGLSVFIQGGEFRIKSSSEIMVEKRNKRRGDGPKEKERRRKENWAEEWRKKTGQSTNRTGSSQIGGKEPAGSTKKRKKQTGPAREIKRGKEGRMWDGHCSSPNENPKRVIEAHDEEAAFIPSFNQKPRRKSIINGGRGRTGKTSRDDGPLFTRREHEQTNMKSTWRGRGPTAGGRRPSSADEGVRAGRTETK